MQQASQKKWFANIVNLLKTKLQNSGAHAKAYNINTKEAATQCWPINLRSGKNLVLATGFEVVGKAKDKHVCPFYDNYCVGFNGCDLYNRYLHGKAWPYKHQGDI